MFVEIKGEDEESQDQPDCYRETVFNSITSG